MEADSLNRWEIPIGRLNQAQNLIGKPAPCKGTRLRDYFFQKLFDSVVSQRYPVGYPAWIGVILLHARVISSKRGICQACLYRLDCAAGLVFKLLILAPPLDSRLFHGLQLLLQPLGLVLPDGNQRPLGGKLGLKLAGKAGHL